MILIAKNRKLDVAPSLEKGFKVLSKKQSAISTSYLRAIASSLLPCSFRKKPPHEKSNPSISNLARSGFGVSLVHDRRRMSPPLSAHLLDTSHRKSSLPPS